MSRQVISDRNLLLALPAVLTIIAISFALILPQLKAPVGNLKTSRAHTVVLGASTQTGQYQISINDVKSSQPDVTTQKKRLTVATTITNLSDSTLQISPGLQMSIVDQNKTSFPMTAQYIPYGTVLGGSLEAKAKASYDIDFEIPASSIPIQFVFQLNANSQSSAIGI